MEEKKKRQKKQRVSRVIIILAVCLVFMVAFNNKYKIYRVNGESMQPELFSGDFVIVEDESFNELNIGDVIVYKSSDKNYIIHRIVYIESDSGKLLVKGDNNERIDREPVTIYNYIGKVVYVL